MAIMRRLPNDRCWRRDAAGGHVNIEREFAQADQSKPIVVFGSFQDLLGTNGSEGIKAKNEFIQRCRAWSC